MEYSNHQHPALLSLALDFHYLDLHVHCKDLRKIKAKHPATLRTAGSDIDALILNFGYVGQILYHIASDQCGNQFACSCKRRRAD